MVTELGCKPTSCQQVPPHSGAWTYGLSRGLACTEAGHLGSTYPAGRGAGSACASRSPLLGDAGGSTWGLGLALGWSPGLGAPRARRKQQVGLWVADLEGGSAGKVLAPKPGTSASPSWSAKGPCCGRMASRGTSLSTEGRAHLPPLLQPPDQPNVSGRRGAVITVAGLVSRCQASHHVRSVVSHSPSS